MAGQQRGRRNPSTRGDFTGNKKEALQREHEESVEARRDEIGLITQSQKAVRDEGVIDLMDGQPKLELDDPDLVRALQAQQAAAEQRDAQPGGPALNGIEGDGEDVEIAEAVGRPLEVDATAREPRAYIPPMPPPAEGTKLGGSDTTIDVVEMEPERPQAAARPGEAIPADQMNQPTMVRMLYDIEDVTIGYGNTFTFREGYRYKVPRWVAAHLEEKGLCNVLSMSPA